MKKLILILLLILLQSCNGQDTKQKNLTDKNKYLKKITKENIVPHEKSNKQKIWKGDYIIKIKALSNADKKEFTLRYYISIIDDHRAVLSIGAEHVQDYSCEGEYYLNNVNNILHGQGICAEDDINDFYLKQENGKYYIKSKRFLNQSWQELTKDY